MRQMHIVVSAVTSNKKYVIQSGKSTYTVKTPVISPLAVREVFPGESLLASI